MISASFGVSFGDISTVDGSGRLEKAGPKSPGKKILISEKSFVPVSFLAK